MPSAAVYEIVNLHADDGGSCVSRSVTHGVETSRIDSFATPER
jgi:hypothetical protein